MKRNKGPRAGERLRVIFAQNLRHFRSKAGLSQFALARELDFSSNFINELEHGRKGPSLKTLAKISRTLNIRPYQFFLNRGDPAYYWERSPHEDVEERFFKSFETCLAAYEDFKAMYSETHQAP